MLTIIDFVIPAVVGLIMYLYGDLSSDIADLGTAAKQGTVLAVMLLIAFFAGFYIA